MDDSSRTSDSAAPPENVRPDIDLNEPIEGLYDDDDDVQISSPESFERAKNDARGKRKRSEVEDLDPDTSNTNNRVRRVIKLESTSSDSAAKRQPPPPPPEFRCPICISPFVEEVSTKCGHIFCKVCISAALDERKQCPTCRKRVNKKHLLRVYLPKASEK